MRAIGYARVSSEQQGADGLGMQAQQTCIETECARRGWTLTGIESDVASGKSRKGRDGLERAIAAIEAGQADVLVVCKLDRLARSLVDFAMLLERFRANGWQLVVLDLGVDMTTPTGEMVASIMAALAQWERRIIGERTRTALAQAKANGKVLGRREGFRESPPETIALIKELRFGAKLSLRAIAAELDRRGVDSPRGKGWNQETVRQAVLAD